MANTFYGDKGKDGIQPRNVLAGTNTVISKFVWGVTNSGLSGATSSTAEAGDVIKMLKVPNGATVVALALTGNREDGAYKLGTSASPSAFVVTTSLSAGLLTNVVAGLPWRASVSDAATVRYEWINVTVVSAGYTLSDEVQLIATYVIDN